jgi:carbonic anhydrase
MSCEKATAPINITDKPNGTCNLKCKYTYKYKDTNTVLKNKKFYLSLTHERSYPSPVKYNEFDFNVDEVRIYSPSLHSYNGTKTDAELIIQHSSINGGLLFVCIPIVKTEETNSSTAFFEHIISSANLYANKENGSTVIKQPLNLNTFVPKTKYYSYNGTLPYPPCTGDHAFVVFSKNDKNAFTTINSTSLAALKKIISETNFPVKTSEFFVNTDGATLNITNTTTDDIYIDCSPVDDDGNVVGENGEPNKIDNKANFNGMPNFMKNISMDKIIKSIWFKIIIGILSGLIVFYIIYWVINKISETGPLSPVAASLSFKKGKTFLPKGLLSKIKK